MPRGCQWHDCNAATTVQSAEERDDGHVVEEYECANGHTFHWTVTV